MTSCRSHPTHDLLYASCTVCTVVFAAFPPETEGPLHFAPSSAEAVGWKPLGRGDFRHDDRDIQVLVIACRHVPTYTRGKFQSEKHSKYCSKRKER